MRLDWFERWSDGAHRPDCYFFGSEEAARVYAIDSARLGGSPLVILESKWIARRSDPPPTPPVEVVRCE